MTDSDLFDDPLCHATQADIDAMMDGTPDSPTILARGLLTLLASAGEDYVPPFTPVLASDGSAYVDVQARGSYGWITTLWTQVPKPDETREGAMARAQAACDAIAAAFEVASRVMPTHPLVERHRFSEQSRGGGR